MGNLPVQFQSRKQRKPLKHAKRKDVLENKFEDFCGEAIDTQHMLISALLPPAVKAFMEECEREVNLLCGSRYRHGKSNSRWGSQKGSIILANQHVAVERPRVRSKEGRDQDLRRFSGSQTVRPGCFYRRYQTSFPARL